MTIRWKLWTWELFVIAAKTATGRSAVKTVSLDIRPSLILNWVFTSIAPFCCTQVAFCKFISNLFCANKRNICEPEKSDLIKAEKYRTPLWDVSSPAVYSVDSTPTCWNLNSFSTPDTRDFWVLPYLIFVTNTTSSACGENFCHVEKFFHMTDCHVEKCLHMRNVKKIYHIEKVLHMINVEQNVLCGEMWRNLSCG